MIEPTLPWMVAVRTPPQQRTFDERVQAALVQQYLFAWGLHHTRRHAGRQCLLCGAAIPSEACWFWHGKRAICQACCDGCRPAEVPAPFLKWRETKQYLTADELEAHTAQRLRNKEAAPVAPGVSA